MNLEEELDELYRQVEAQEISGAEFLIEKARAIERAHVLSPEPDDADALREFETVRIINRQRVIDTEWQLERELYMVLDRDGNPYVPTYWRPILLTVLTPLFGAVATIFFAYGKDRSGRVGPGLEPWTVVVGCLIILAGLGYAGWLFYVARRYASAHARYQERRQAATNNPPNPAKGDRW